MLKIGIVSFANVHANGYANAIMADENTELVGIVESDKSYAEKYGAKAFETIDELVASDVDLVVVSSENVNHFDAVMKCAKAKKHILCDLPLSPNLAEAQKMVDTCRENGVKLFGGLSCRFHPAYTRTKAAISQLGDIVGIKAVNQSINIGGWYADKNLSGGGCAMDHVVHVLDMICDMMQSKPINVYASLSNRRFGKDVEDAGLVTIDFENGAFATIDCSWSVTDSYKTWGTVKLSVTGTEGVCDMDMLAQHFNVYTDDDMRHNEGYWGDNMDAELVKGLVKSAETDENLVTTADECLTLNRVLCAVYESAKSGQPVKI